MKTAKTPHYPAATMRPDEVPKDVNKAFDLVKNLMFDQVHKFHRRYGGDLDELKGQAGEAFTLGHQEFVSGKTKTGQPIKAPYATSIRLWVWFSMFDTMRARIAKNDATEAIGERDFQEADRPSWDTGDFVANLGPDATQIVNLLLTPPKAVKGPAERKGGAPRNYRSTVREYLTDRGWAMERVCVAFAEIKRALG